MNDIEFLPENVRSRRATRGRLVRMGWLLALCLLGMVGLTVIRQGRISSARADLATLSCRSEEVRTQVAMVAPLEKQMADLLIKKRIDEELGGRTDCTAILAELCKLMPNNLALVSLDLESVEELVELDDGNRNRSGRASSGGRSRNRTTRKRCRVVLTGLAPSDVDVANFIGQLSSSCLFDDVNMGYARTVEFSGRLAREFRASFYLVN